ncbi:uncharacterized protein LODBEIA_P38010 [Lodderomyces beijingensis]|uniref:Cytidyltransferase-like domain-containing protein n=1 Tax=Lodderomyces beijingensis TaxID=1775926 RepID=A0ABP0ZQG9_9ASCO
MMNPVVLLDDPIKKDYSPLLRKVVTLIGGCDRLDVIIQQEINDVTHLNEILFRYYTLLRTEVQEREWFNYNFSINIIFNIKKQKLLQLAPQWHHAYVAQSETEVIKTPKSHTTVLDVDLAEAHFSELENKSAGEFKTTAVGGTFDHLHDGHKILLSMASFLTKSRMIIGITGPDLLKNKKYGEFLESFTRREQSVIEFLHLIMGDDQYYEIYKIDDVCGPTGYLRDIDGLVISHETASGARFVNDYRKDHGFKVLDVTAIKVIGQEESNADNSWKGKISSTDIREREFQRKESLEHFAHSR